MSNQTKYCIKCDKHKSLDEFSSYHKTKDGKQHYCKECSRNIKRVWDEKNAEHVKAYSAAKWKDNPEKGKQQNRQFREKNPNYHKEWAIKNRETRNKQLKIRRDSEPLFKLRMLLRHRIKESLKRKNFKKNKRMVEWLGCNIQDVAAHLEKQFKPGMTWENHGEWHIDHIIPLCSAKNIEELYTLSHYSNLQPLWAKENLVKNGKMP